MHQQAIEKPDFVVLCCPRDGRCNDPKIKATISVFFQGRLSICMHMRFKHEVIFSKAMFCRVCVFRVGYV